MKTYRPETIVSHLLLLGLLLGIAGCASPSYRTNEKSVSTLQSLAKGIESTGTQMDIAVTELNNLVNKPQADLRPQFDRFSAAVSKLSALSNQVHNAGLKLASRGKLHFADWDKELALIQNESIRSSGQARKLELQSRFDSVRNSCLKLATSLAPVQSDLNDVQHLLNSDLNTSGLAAIRETANRVTQQAEPVRQSIGNMVAELRSLGVALSPQNMATPAPAK